MSRLFPLLETWPQMPLFSSFLLHQQYFVCSVFAGRTGCKASYLRELYHSTTGPTKQSRASTLLGS